MAKIFPHIKLNKKSAVMTMFGFSKRVSVPRQAESLLEAARLAEKYRCAGDNFDTSLDGLKRCLSST